MYIEDLINYSVHNDHNDFYNCDELKKIIIKNKNKINSIKYNETINEILNTLYNIIDTYNNENIISYNDIIQYYCIFQLLIDEDNIEYNKIFYEVIIFICAKKNCIFKY
jgi:hypothetical protein